MIDWIFYVDFTAFEICFCYNESFLISGYFSMAALSIQERKRLRQIGHALNPVVMLGDKGLTETVVEELNRALNDHELIKVKIAGEDREARAATITEIATASGAEVVQTIGKIALLYKKAAKQNPKLSNLVRHSHLSN